MASKAPLTDEDVDRLFAVLLSERSPLRNALPATEWQRIGFVIFASLICGTLGLTVSTLASVALFSSPIRWFVGAGMLAANLVGFVAAQWRLEQNAIERRLRLASFVLSLHREKHPTGPLLQDLSMEDSLDWIRSHEDALFNLFRL